MNSENREDVMSVKDLPQHNNNLCYPEGCGGNWSSITIKKQPYVCPVCSGRGIVSNGFYNSTGNVWVTSTTAPEKCRSCGGTGVIWG